MYSKQAESDRANRPGLFGKNHALRKELVSEYKKGLISAPFGPHSPDEKCLMSHIVHRVTELANRVNGTFVRIRHGPSHRNRFHISCWRNLAGVSFSRTRNKHFQILKDSEFAESSKAIRCGKGYLARSSRRILAAVAGLSWSEGALRNCSIVDSRLARNAWQGAHPSKCSSSSWHSESSSCSSR